MKFKIIINIIALLFAVNLTKASKKFEIERCEDEKCFKTLLKTRPNLLICFAKSESDAKEPLKLFRDVSSNIKGTSDVALIDCEKAKKLCKKLKIQPKSFELKYYKDGAFNKDYDRKLTKNSLLGFFADPVEIPWDEEDSSKDVVHLRDGSELNKLLKKSKLGVLIMFYAPWCGFCKKLKPEYSQAATEVKSIAILAGMNVDQVELVPIKKQYNISGYPTLLYFKNGDLQYQYGGEYTKDSLVNWVKDPHPPKEKEPEKSWADEPDTHVQFLTDNTFDDMINKEKSVLVMFYAPWCGHCKTLKPILNSVAKRMKEENVDGVIAAVDATKETKLAERFKLKGFPTVKYFKNGKFAWDFNERSEEKIFNYMKNPNEPPKPDPEWKDEQSAVVHLDDSTFASFLKTKKHALVMFYAPWCGHCKNAKPHFTRAANDFKDDMKVSFVAVDCTQVKATCEQFGVKGFPSIKYFNFGKNQQDYEGAREYNDFVRFMQNPSEPIRHDPKQDWTEISGHENIAYLDDTNFDEFIKTHKKVLVMFYAPWCGHCKNMKPAYAQAATSLKQFSNNESILAAVDSTKVRKINGKFEIKGFPTLKYFENGDFKMDYNLGRTQQDLIAFMTDENRRIEL